MICFSVSEVTKSNSILILLLTSSCKNIKYRFLDSKKQSCFIGESNKMETECFQRDPIKNALVGNLICYDETS